MLFKLAFKQTWRDARAGDVLLLGLAIVIAVAALSTVGLLADRVGRALERDAAQMLGADLLLEADAPIGQDLIDQAKLNGLEWTQTWQFPSMVGGEQTSNLAAIKAVASGYPLRGQLRVTQSIGQADQAVSVGPSEGKVWVDPQVLSNAGLKIGDALRVGDITLLVERALTYEPDRGAQFMNLAPRVMLAAPDLEKTGLITLGSRVTYALLLAGKPEQIQAYRTWLTARLKKGQKLVSVETGRPEIRRSLDRAQQFLVLVSLLSVLIASIAIVLGARQFGKRHLKSVAVLRCLGATSRTVSRLFLIEFCIVSLTASLIGLLLGALSQQLIVFLLGSLLGAELPAPRAGIVLQSLLLGVFLLLALGWPSLQILHRVTPALIMRQNLGFPAHGKALNYLPAIGCIVGLLCWIAQDLKLGGSLALGFILAALVFSVMGYALLAGLAYARNSSLVGPGVRFALSGVVRRRHVTVVQMTALALGMMAILLLTIVRTDLLEGWQRSLPPDAPNRFLLNIQTPQLAEVKRVFGQAGLGSTQFFPMVRGRLVSRNGVSIGADDYQAARAKQLIEREFNLTYAQHLPKIGELVAGRDLEPEKFEVSLESGLAETLNLKLSDELEFDVAGVLIKVAVTSIRKIDWDSMQANFFAIMTTRALEGQPQSWMSAFHLPPRQSQWLEDLLRALPNLTLFDLGAILAELRAVLDKVSLAVQVLFGFSLLAGVIVLAGALSATRDERIHEAALLRALGATGSQLKRAQSVEFVLTGLFAGLMAAGGACLIAWGLARWVFQFTITFSLTPWLLSVMACMLGSWLVGGLTLRGVLLQPPARVLRYVA
jgi:putative ABC transport system permease protein